MKKKPQMKTLKLNRETVRRLNPPELKDVVAAGLSNNSCFPDICQEWDSSAC